MARHPVPLTNRASAFASTQPGIAKAGGPRHESLKLCPSAGEGPGSRSLSCNLPDQ